MDQSVILLKQYAPQIVQYVLMGLGTLVVLGGAYIKATPTKEDDQWFDKIEAMPVVGVLLRVLVRFSPVLRKEDEPTSPPTTAA